MKTFVLLLLALMTGCEASSEESEVKGCIDGWVDFTCRYPKPTKTYKAVEVKLKPKQITLGSNVKNSWENDGRFSLYHNTSNKNVRVIIRQLEHEDSGEYKCTFYQNSDDKDKLKGDLKVDDECQKFNQTAYKTAKTTIACKYPENSYESNVKFFCKESGSICEDILSTQSSPLTNGTFTLTESYRGFNVSISKVSSQHEGVYWCGLKSKDGSSRAGLRQIRLTVEDITTFTRSPTAGHNFTYWCENPNGASYKKFICKGDDPSLCQPLINTQSPKNNSGKFSMRENVVERNITITVRKLTLDDSGTYWCGAQSSFKTRSNQFFLRFVMTVVPQTTSTPSSISSTSTPSVSSTPSASTPAQREGPSMSAVIIPVVICVALLVLVLILVLVYKRFECSKLRTNGETQTHKEDRAYAEIQERPQKPDSGTALQTIYVTANLPTDTPASQSYSNITFKKSAEASDDIYSTVMDNDQCPAYSTVNHPSRLSDDPFYSTLSPPQQQ